MKKIFPLILILLIIAGGLGLFAVQKFKKTPEYSLIQTGKAFTQKDLTTVEKYIDIESLTNKAVDSIIELQMKELKEEVVAAEDSWESLGTSMAEGMIQLMKPGISKMIQSAIKDFVENENNEKREPSNNEILGEKFDLSKYSIKKEKPIVQINGKLASVLLSFENTESSTPLKLKLRMRNRGDYWQIFEISNIAEILDDEE
jgi:hypothetical protein